MKLSAYSITCNQKKEYEITSYTDNLATGEEKREAVKKLVACYPGSFANKDKGQLQEFIALFNEAVEAVGMTGKQLHDAVIKCIATKHQYGQFQIADVTGFSDKIRLYTYDEYQCNPTNKVGSKLLRNDGKSVWFVDVEDLETVNRMANLLNKD